MASNNGRLKGETVTPHETMKLVKAVGVSKAARALGVSTTQLHKARRGNVVSRVTEVAAQGVLAAMSAAPAPASRRAPAPPATIMVLAEVPAGKRGLLERFLKGLGATYEAA